MPYLSAMTRTSMEAVAFLEVSMLTRRDVPFVTVIGLLPFVLAACNEATSSTDPRTQPPLVRIQAVEISVQSERSFTGIVAARVQSDLGFRVPGKVLERLVDAGQTVRRGQPLMRIDPTDLRLAMRAHEEAVAAARARAHQTAEDEVRYRNLVSPRQVSDAANRQTRTFEARYVLEGRLADAPLGSTISIQIPDGRSAPALQVPIGALFDPGKGPGVWLVEGETPRVTWRAVHIVGLSDEAASVVGDFKPGDRVVALGAHLLQEGKHVRLAESKAAQNVAAKSGGQQ